MRIKSFLFASLLILAACSPGAKPAVEPTATPVPPTATGVPPTPTVIPSTATPVPEYERLSPTVIRIKDVIITSEATLSPEKFELVFHTSIPCASAGTFDPSVKDVKFEFSDTPPLVLTPNYGGGGGGGCDPQGYEVGEAMQGFLVGTPIQSGQLIHIITYATLDPSTGVTEPVPFEFYLLVQ